MKIKQLLNKIFCCVTQPKKIGTNVSLSDSAYDNDELKKSKTQLSKESINKRENITDINNLKDYGISSGNIPTVKQKNKNNILTSSSNSENSDEIGTYIPENAIESKIVGNDQYSNEDGWIV